MDFDNTNQQTNLQIDTIPAEKPPKAPKAKKTGLVILLVLCGIWVLLGLLSRFTQEPSQEASSKDSPLKIFINKEKSQKKQQKHIAVIHVEGTIQEANETYNQEWLISTIQDLTYNHNNLGILLYIDSPGGGVYESDEVYLELLDYKENSGKPVWAYLGTLAASGGYYIACAADYIIANRNCLTGSIGVVAGQSVDFSEFLTTHGIKVTTFTAGSNKDMLGISTPVTQEQAEIMQSIADDCYNQFIKIVADSRNLTLQQVTSLADGRIYTATQALNKGLVDTISRYEDACDTYTEALRRGPVDFVHYYPEVELDFMNYVIQNISTFVASLTATSTTEGLLQKAQKKVLPEISYPAYYYCP